MQPENKNNAENNNAIQKIGVINVCIIKVIIFLIKPTPYLSNKKNGKEEFKKIFESERIMAEEFSLEEGKKLIELARNAIEYFSASGRKYSAVCEEEKFKKKRGVFVTLNGFPSKELRGCIGFPHAILPLWNAVIEAATGAAFNDSRFNAVSASELENIVIEISVLTEPQKVKRENALKEIVIGKDGLIVKKNFQSGLLLPQVATEYNWDTKTFLEQTCRKAGIIPTAWKQEETEIYKFQAKIFKEKEPKGKIEE